MHGAIVINFRNGNIENKTAKKVKRFEEEFSKLGVTLDVLLNDGSLAEVVNGEVKLNIKRPDFVIYLDKDKYLARLLERDGIRLFNQSAFIELCDDKMLTHIELANHSINMPKTMAGPLIFNSNSFEDKEDEMLEKVSSSIGFPLLIKGVYGSLGLNMVYVESKDDLKEKYLSMRGQPIIFQKYLKSSYGRSIRVLVIDNEIFGAFERYNPIDYRSNFGENASSKMIEISAEIKEIIGKLLSFTNIEYAGVDLLYGENEMVLCEMNSNAFFFEFEKITGLNVAKRFAEMVIRKVYE